MFGPLFRNRTKRSLRNGDAYLDKLQGTKFKFKKNLIQIKLQKKKSLIIER